MEKVFPKISVNEFPFSKILKKLFKQKLFHRYVSKFYSQVKRTDKRQTN